LRTFAGLLCRSPTGRLFCSINGWGFGKPLIYWRREDLRAQKTIERLRVRMKRMKRRNGRRRKRRRKKRRRKRKVIQSRRRELRGRGLYVHSLLNTHMKENFFKNIV